MDGALTGLSCQWIKTQVPSNVHQFRALSPFLLKGDNISEGQTNHFVLTQAIQLKGDFKISSRDLWVPFDRTLCSHFTG